MKKSKKNKIKIRILSLVIYLSLLIMIILNSNKIVAIILTICMYILGISSIIFNFRKLKKKHAKLNKEIRRIVTYTTNFLLFDFITLVGIGLIYKFIGITTKSANQQEIVNILKNNFSLYTFIYIILLGPIIEEAIFRFLPRIIFKNDILFITVSSSIFALMHCFGSENIFWIFLIYFPSALYLGYAYYKTKDLFVTISMHITSNFISTLLILKS